MAKNELAVAQSFALVGMTDGMDDELKEAWDDEMDDLGNDTSVNMRKIKMPMAGGNAFQVESDIEGDPDNKKTFDAVILFSHLMNARWESDYNGEATPPTCTSYDGKQGAIFETGEIFNCDTCPHNQYGSGENGVGKTCKNMRRIFMMLSGQPWLYTFSVPPTSVKEVTKQLTRITATTRLPLSRLVVRFSLTKGATKARSGVTKVSVESIGRLDPAAYETTKKMREVIKAQYKNVGIDSGDYETAPQQGGPVYDAQYQEAPRQAPPQAAGPDGFMEIPDGVRESLPFN